MAELPFGSVQQLWPGISPAVFGFPQPPLSPGARPFGTISPGMITNPSPPFGGSLMAGIAPPGLSAPSPFGYNEPGAIASGPVTGIGWSSVPSPLGGAVPAIVGAEMAVGVTAQSLLAAVAVRRGQPLGPTSDQEVEDFIYDALDLVPGTNDVEVRCESGRATVTGSVPHKRLKRDVGEIAWAIPSVNDVQNNVTITTRRRARATGREAESQPTAARKQT